MGLQHRYFLVYKPFGTLCQFTREVPGHVTLRDTFPDLPQQVYPVGRLDQDSEGMLLITDDNNLKNNVISPSNRVRKRYLAQVEGTITAQVLERLGSGVRIRVRKKEYTTKPASVRYLHKEPKLPDRDPPIRYRASIPVSWIEIGITEGKNRQVRRMCAKVGFPVLRLVRVGIGQLELGHMQPGDMIEMGKKDVYSKLGIPDRPVR